MASVTINGKTYDGLTIKQRIQLETQAVNYFLRVIDRSGLPEYMKPDLRSRVVFSAGSDRQLFDFLSSREGSEWVLDLVGIQHGELTNAAKSELAYQLAGLVEPNAELPTVGDKPEPAVPTTAR